MKVMMPMPVAIGSQASPPISSSLSTANSAAAPVAAENSAENAGCADS